MAERGFSTVANLLSKKETDKTCRFKIVFDSVGTRYKQIVKTAPTFSLIFHLIS